jgi:hypothetical protein
MLVLNSTGPNKSVAQDVYTVRDQMTVWKKQNLTHMQPDGRPMNVIRYTTVDGVP